MITLAAAVFAFAWAPQARTPPLSGSKARRERVYESYLGADRSLPRGTITVQVAAPEGDVPTIEQVERLATTATSCSYSRVVHTARIRHQRTWNCGSTLARTYLFERVEREGRFVFEARFENVPETEHRISALGDRLIEQRVQYVRPGETVRFVYQRVEPERAYGFRVRLVGPKGPLTSKYLVWPAWSAWARIPDEFPLSQRPVAGGVHSYGLAKGADVPWCVYKHGYQRAYGDRGSFQRSPAPEEGHWANVALEPGFGVRIRTTDPEGRALAGVRIRFDEQTFVTDWDGVTYLSSSKVEPEARLEVVGFRFAAGDVDEDGAFEWHHHGLHAILD